MTRGWPSSDTKILFAFDHEVFRLTPGYGPSSTPVVAEFRVLFFLFVCRSILLLMIFSWHYPWRKFDAALAVDQTSMELCHTLITKYHLHCMRVFSSTECLHMRDRRSFCILIFFRPLLESLFDYASWQSALFGYMHTGVLYFGDNDKPISLLTHSRFWDSRIFQLTS